MSDGRERACLLLVEDHEDAREALRAVLKLRGYTVLCAEDGEQAVRIMKSCRGPPDLVITDLRMRYNGWSLRQQMLTDRELASIPVVVLSSTPPEDVDESLHAVAYLQKPVRLPELLRVVDQHCDASGRSAHP